MSTIKSIPGKLSILFVIIFMLAATPFQTAHATSMRYAKPAASGAGDCSSWANACALQTALTGATSGSEIWVMQGAHMPTATADRTATFQLKDGVALYGGFVGTETARDQRNPALNITILSGDIDNNDSQTPVITDLATVTGNTSNSYHVVTGVTGATLDGFIITAGNANGADMYSTGSGGGMFNDFSSPTLTDITFSGNAATSNGGGMYNGSFANPALIDVIFSSNMATDGGGMYNWDGSPTLTDVAFSGNKADGGGGMYNASSSPTLTNVTFSSNKADSSGGGMYNTSSSPTLTNVTFSNNTVIGGDGGGMFNNSSSAILTNVTFSDNMAYVAAGMFNTSSNPTLTNVTFSGNLAITVGGGMFNIFSSPQIRNTIFWGNQALSVDYPGTSQMDNSNTAPIGIPVLSDNVIQDGCPAGSACTNIITADPLRGAFGNYGGFTQTVPILAGSSAIDKGNDSICPASDQRGMARPQGAHCDIGTYEYAPTPGAVTLNSISSQDGWVLESSETSVKGGLMNSAAPTFNLGDDKFKKQYRGILSFGTGAGLPDNATISAVTLKVKKSAIVGGGNPVVTFKGFIVDIKNGFFGTSAALQTGDFQAAASKSYGPFNTALAGGWYIINLTAGKGYINKLNTNFGLTQIRLRFNVDDNNNAIANVLSLFSGNAPAASRPQLVITYYIP